MNKQFAICILALSMMSCLSKNHNMREIEQVKQIAHLPIGNNDSVKGVSAPYTAYVNGSLLVAGGCNFPTAPASKGGIKEYYKSIYRYNQDLNSWTHIGDMPMGLAYGASVVYGSEWICIGGNNNEGATASVYSFEYNGTLVTNSLPDLPVTMDNFAATINDKKIYVAGGNINSVSGNKMYMLDLSERKQWVELTDFPGAGRIQPILLNGKDGAVILMGGFQLGTMESKPILPEDVYAYHPSLGEWAVETQLPLSTMDNEPIAMVGGFGVNISDSHIIIGGGVNRNRFINALDASRLIEQAISNENIALADSLRGEKASYMTHPVEWYRFNSDLYAYNLSTKEWVLLGSDAAIARAGAGAVTDGKVLFVVDGELKPGVRTDEVNQICLK